MDGSEMTKLRADACDGEVPIERGEPMNIKRKEPGSRGVLCRLPVLLSLCLGAVLLITAVSLLARYLPSCGDRGVREPPAPPGDLMRGRLPAAVLPRRYNLRLRPFLYEEDAADSRLGRRFTFDGWLRLTVECRRPTDRVTLHAKNLTVHGRPTVTRLAGAGPAGAGADLAAGYETVDEHSFLVLKLNRTLSPHQMYDIYIEYSGLLGDELVGFYPSPYLDPMNNTRYIATTQLEGPYARLVYPCFDEPAFKAPYDVQLEHRADMQALSNGMETGTVRLDSRWSRTTFASTPSMSSYLPAFIVHDFSSVNMTNDQGCLIRVWCQSDQVHLAPFALNVSEVVQSHFDVYLDSPFPLTKQDHVAVADMQWLAMENWGLITYRDAYLLYGMHGQTGPQWSKFITYLICHELAHQWFGNLVTMEWWDDLWLNEGFASYMEHVGVALIHPNLYQYADVIRYLHSTAAAMWVDSLGSYPAVRAPVNATEEGISRQVNPVVYKKGASLLYMLEHFLTLEVFNRGVRSYVKDRAYKSANSEHLWRELTEADKDDGKHDVKTVMDTWTLQRGYPVVTLTRTGNEIEARQEIFLQYGKELQEDQYGHLGYRWYVPLTYMYKSGPSDQYDKPLSIWLEPANDTTTFSLPSGTPTEDWYLANAKIVGFYRVNYDSANWQRLVDQAKEDPNAIDQENRVGLLHDAAALVLAESLDLEIYLALAESLQNNTDLDRDAVLYTMREVSDLTEDRTNRSDARRSAQPSSPMEEYMRRLVEPLYADRGWDPSFVPDMPTTSWWRRKNPIDITATACLYGNQDCIDRATGELKDHMARPDDNVIPRNFRKVVYCYGLRFGGPSEWDFAMDALRTPDNDRSERSRWISALSCSTDAHRLRSCLRLMLDSSSFTRSDIQLLLIGMANNADGYEVAWDFMRHNWGDAKNIFKGNSQLLGDVVGEMASNFFNTEKKLQQLLDLGRAHSMGALRNPYTAAVTATKLNVRRKLKIAGKVRKWMTAALNDR